jgi:hypothetical protein
LWALGALTTADVAVESLAELTARRKRENAGSDIRPARSSAALTFHVITVATKTAAVVRDDAVVVADSGQPPGLVHHNRPWSEVTVELARSVDLSKQPEQVARLPSR